MHREATALIGCHREIWSSNTKMKAKIISCKLAHRCQFIKWHIGGRQQWLEIDNMSINSIYVPHDQVPLSSPALCLSQKASLNRSLQIPKLADATFTNARRPSDPPCFRFSAAGSMDTSEELIFVGHPEANP